MATAQDAPKSPAQALHQTPPFTQLPAQWIEASSGALTQGDWVRLKLAEGVVALLDGTALPSVEGWTVFGFDRDHGAAIEFALMRDGERRAITLPIQKRSYNIQRIDGLPPEYVTPPPAALARIKADQKKKKAARAHSDARPDFSTDFIWPLKGKITGVFGSQRFYNGEGRRPHYGVDIAAPAGTAVVAAAPGRVSLAASDMYFEGGLIFIDHGLGVTSIYMHLGDVLVSPGQFVAAGEEIGRVGSTGRSTGAHLDWRLEWRGQHLDPMQIVGIQ